MSWNSGVAGGRLLGFRNMHIKVVVTGRRAVYRGAALERAGVVLGVVHADQRPVVVQRRSPQLSR